MKIIICFIFLSFQISEHFCQEVDINLTKGKWKFCVMDTLIEPYKCQGKVTTYKFKKSGKYEQTGLSMVVNGKAISKLKGEWSLKGSSLEIRTYSVGNISINAKKIEIKQLDKNKFYSPQPDWKTVYWLFIRENN